MKAAFAYWDKRIAPVFDTAKLIYVVEAESGRIVRELSETLPNDQSARKALVLAEIGVEELICGAVSKREQAIITAYGIRIFPFISGDLREVIEAWLQGRLENSAYAMPGCCRRGGKKPFRRSESAQEVFLMNGRGGEMGRGMGRGQGAGRGRGQGGRGLGRMGGPFAAGPAGNCVCPQCGHTEAHQAGIPCAGLKCPKCGSIMTRQ